MLIGVPKETAPGERRVALVPETVKKLLGKQHTVMVEAGAGLSAGVTDAEYLAAGATIVTRAELIAKAEVLLCVAPPGLPEIGALREGSSLVSLLYPLARPELAQALAHRKVLAIALDLIPRTTLAQAMDVLSSQASFAGYWAVVAAAARLPRIFPLQMTAAGTVTPSRVLVMGTGVAGLQAIGTAKRLGAVVEASDVRPETKEQVESLGAKFLVVEAASQAGSGGYAAEQSAEYQAKQRELVAQAVARADVVITTALIPGRKAPVLITEDHLRSMRPGSVAVDLAAEQGGNIVGSEPGLEVVRHGVTIIGALSAASNVAAHASQAFSRNLEKLLQHLTSGGAWKLDSAGDEIARGALITRDGAVVHAGVRAALEKAAPPSPSNDAALAQGAAEASALGAADASAPTVTARTLP